MESVNEALVSPTEELKEEVILSQEDMENVNQENKNDYDDNAGNFDESYTKLNPRKKRPSLQFLQDASIVNERVNSYPYESTSTPSYKSTTLSEDEKLRSKSADPSLDALSLLSLSPSSSTNVQENKKRLSSPMQPMSSSLLQQEQPHSDSEGKMEDQNPQTTVESTTVNDGKYTNIIESIIDDETTSSVSLSPPVSPTKPTASSDNSKTTLDHLGKISDLRVVVKELKESQAKLEKELSEKDKLV